MELEIIEKELKITTPKIFCFVCKTEIAEHYNYMLMKDTFFCDICYNNLYNGAKSPLDNKFENIDNKTEDLLKGMVDKNMRIKLMEDNINSLNETLNKVLETFSKLFEVIEESNNN